MILSPVAVVKSFRSHASRSMSKTSLFIPNRLKPWIDARQRFRLSHAHVQMAFELGLNPKKFDWPIIARSRGSCPCRTLSPSCTSSATVDDAGPVRTINKWRQRRRQKAGEEKLRKQPLDTSSAAQHQQ
jgi:hypothetical protein